MSEQLELQQPKQQITNDLSPKVAEVKDLYAPEASAAQFAVFRAACHTYGLSPLKGEILCLKAHGHKPYITKAGCFSVANRNANFDGIASGIVYDGDELTSRANESLLLVRGPDHFKMTVKNVKGAYCNVYRKDRTIATAVYCDLTSYRGTGPKWQNQPDVMILKTAEMNAIRKAFELDLDMDNE